MSITISKVTITDGVIRKGKVIGKTFTAGSAKTYPAKTLVALDTSTLKYVPFVKGGTTNGNGVVAGTLDADVVATGAADFPAAIMFGGELQTEKTIIDADGDASNIDEAVKFSCLDKGLILIDTTDLYVADNS